jgi:hypothetical protein
LHTLSSQVLEDAFFVFGGLHTVIEAGYKFVIIGGFDPI